MGGGSHLRTAQVCLVLSDLDSRHLYPANIVKIRQSYAKHRPANMQKGTNKPLIVIFVFFMDHMVCSQREFGAPEDEEVRNQTGTDLVYKSCTRIQLLTSLVV